MDRAKILDKITKALAMAKDSRGDSNEAAVALGMAQKMMKKFGITEAELGAVGYTSEKVSCPIQANKVAPARLTHLIALINKAFGVTAVIEREMRVSDLSYAVRYFGPEHRVVMAGHAHVVVFRAMEAAWRNELTTRYGSKAPRGVRAGFELGWLGAVHNTVAECGFTEEETTGTDLAKTQHYGKELGFAKQSNMRVNGNALARGAEAGADFKLHRGVARENLKITA